MTKITVSAFRRYLEIMEKAETVSRKGDMLLLDLELVKAVTDDEVSMRRLSEMDVRDLLLACKTVHFLMQEVIMPKFAALAESEEGAEAEVSAFDEYDVENGYEEEVSAESIWKICKESIDRIVKIAIRGFGDSFSDCMKQDIVRLLDYVKFELAAMKEGSRR